MVNQDNTRSVVRTTLRVLAVVYFIGTIVFIAQNYNRADDIDRKQATLERDLRTKLEDTETETRSSVNTLADRLGMTYRELAKRAAAQAHDKLELKGQAASLQRQEREIETRLAKLEHRIGDLNRQKEPVATSLDELEILKQRGDRNYYEFALVKGEEATELASVGLQLEKADPKENRFSLYMLADYKRLEKRDRTINMPLQVYTGREHDLYEVVVNTVERNRVTGYLSTPKSTGLQQPIQRAAAHSELQAQPAQTIQDSKKISLLLPQNLAPAPGGSFAVSVYLTGGRDVESVPMRIDYDPRVLQFVALSRGDFLAQDGQPVILTQVHDPNSGTLQIAAQRPSGTAGVSGNGTVVYIVFAAKAKGEGHVSVMTAGMHGQTSITVN
jgi:hypothetical protein